MIIKYPRETPVAGVEPTSAPVVIGFIGDSITQGWPLDVDPTEFCIAALGPNYSAINQGVGGTTSAHWANDDFDGRHLMSEAIHLFSLSQVETIHFSIGYNDLFYGISPADYGRHLQTIVDTLREAGFKRLIISDPEPARNLSESFESTYFGYVGAIGHVVAQNPDFAFRGDNSRSWTLFAQRPDELFDDNVHQTEAGAQALGEIWADAIRPYL